MPAPQTPNLVELMKHDQGFRDPKSMMELMKKMPAPGHGAVPSNLGEMIMNPGGPGAVKPKFDPGSMAGGGPGPGGDQQLA